MLMMTWMITPLEAQTILNGRVFDQQTGESLPGANVIIQQEGIGTVTDLDGEFKLETHSTLPLKLRISYIGYDTVIIEITDANKIHRINLSSGIRLKSAIIRENRITEKQKESPYEMGSMDAIAIKQNASSDYYSGAEILPGVQKTTAAFGFNILNTRGFNSTSPVRTLQLIDGMDNQAPGLNFSLGNFLGVSELDLLKIEIIAGATGAYYGPAAFNGVINMETKNPFHTPGFSGLIRLGERNLFESAIRFADVITNKKGIDVFAYKMNLYALKANDWEADSEEPITDSEVDNSNPGGFDAVNIYGDAYYARNDYEDPSCSDEYLYPGLGIFYRHGYKEVDLVDYDTKNYKANVALHLRTHPSLVGESPVFILSSAFGAGTTVYQGDNRFSLRDIQFFQNKFEYSKLNKFYLRAYHTFENAGRSYDPYFTALRLQELSKTNENWNKAYTNYWFDDGNIPEKMKSLGYPQVMGTWPETITFDCDSAQQWLIHYADSLTKWHDLATIFADTATDPGGLMDYLVPGTNQYDSAFQSITTKFNNEEGGTRFFDKSSLIHLGGEYIFNPVFLSEWRVGGNYRMYSPRSQGTIFSDTAGTRIHIHEIGAYTGIKKKFLDQKLIGSATIRFDKSKNLDWVISPAASLIYHPSKGETYLRVSYSSAVRNPTLVDQYQYLNVGPAILAGHIDQVDSLITEDSFKDYLMYGGHHLLDYFSIDAIRPERVRTIEIGIKTKFKKKVYADLTYYRNSYKDFLGYLIALTADIDTNAPFPSFDNLQVYRYSANTNNTVTTQGFSVAVNYYLSNTITLSGNYSYNALRKTVNEDPIIPAYNTPEHKINLGISGWEMKLTNSPLLRHVGFSINYKWVEGFRFEGSPQFTGYVPTYGVLDAQVNVRIEKINTTFKVGASNVFDHQHIETYGGPKTGRHTYISAAYNF